MHSLPAIPLFPAGQTVVTPGALALLEEAKKTPLEFISAIFAVIEAIFARRTRRKTN